MKTTMLPLLLTVLLLQAAPELSNAGVHVDTVPVVYLHTITIRPGFNFIAYEFAGPPAAVGTILSGPTLPDGLTLFKFNKATGGFDVEEFTGGVWSPGVMTLAHGEGAILHNGSTTPFPVTFAGLPPPDLPPLVIGPCERCLVSRRVAGLGLSTYADIVGAPPMNGSTVYKFSPDAGAFTTSIFLSGAWYTPAGALTPAPTVALGESVWITSVPEPGISVGGASCAATDVKLTWAGPEVLQSAPALGGPWATVAGATSPFCDPPPPPGGIKFYRLICPVGGSAVTVTPIGVTPIGPVVAAYTIPIGPGFNFIAYEFAGPPAAVGTILSGPTLPDGLTLFKFNKATGGFDVEEFTGGVWSPGVMTLAHGEGAILHNGSTTPFPVTFAGLPPPDLPPLVIGPCERCLVSRRVAGLGLSTYADIVGAPPMNGSTVYKFSPDAGAFTTSIFLSGAWYTPAGALTPAPTVVLGESVWIAGPPPPLTISTGIAAAPCAATDVKLTWAGPAVLLSSPTLGPGAVWTPVAGATAPYCIAPGGGANFYRVACPAIP